MATESPERLRKKAAALKKIARRYEREADKKSPKKKTKRARIIAGRLVYT